MWTKEQKQEYRRKYHQKNRSKILKRVAKWTEENRERYLEYQRNYAKRTSRKRIEYRKNRRQASIQFRVKGNLAHRITSVLRGYGAKKNFRRTEEITGCTMSFLKNYLAGKFQDGMTWENYGNGEGRWNIDHKIPCAAFDLSDIDEQHKCFHYSNLHPMWWRENLRKGVKSLVCE